jgi:hypothetical protein
MATPPERSFEPVPRHASEYRKGAAFARAMLVRQHGDAVPVAEIAARHQHAIAVMAAAARDDGDREFARGYAAAGADYFAAPVCRHGRARSGLTPHGKD